MRSRSMVVGFASVVLIISALVMTNIGDGNDIQTGYVVDIYHSPTCGCCELYEEYLKEMGFRVESRETWNVESIKRALGIPVELWSCHTVVMGDYFVEGHVPVEAINRLLNEGKELKGIALPGMPLGSPGMSGIKNEEFVIYAVTPDSVTEFMRI